MHHAFLDNKLLFPKRCSREWCLWTLVCRDVWMHKCHFSVCMQTQRHAPVDTNNDYHRFRLRVELMGVVTSVIAAAYLQLNLPTCGVPICTITPDSSPTLERYVFSISIKTLFHVNLESILINLLPFSCLFSYSTFSLLQCSAKFILVILICSHHPLHCTWLYE